MVSIAIDGPAGAGKSSICTRLAQELHYLHIDTGALYRAVGLFVLRQNKNPADPTDVLPLLPHIHIDLRFEAGEQRILLKVTMEDAMQADEIFTILMGDKVAPRREFIEQNARYVENLDI